MRTLITLSLGLLAVNASADPCAPMWDRAIGTPGAFYSQGSPSVSALAVWNDTLYIGGAITSFGGVPGTTGVARYHDGVVSSLAGGADSVSVNAFLIFDDGAGDDLYIGGSFPSVGDGMPGTRALARWNGSAFEAIPGNPFTSGDAILAMAEFNGVLFAGGLHYTDPKGFSWVPLLASWDGAVWRTHTLSGTLNPYVLCMTTWNDGSGEKLVIGGRFSSIDPDPSNPSDPPVLSENILAFDGATWSGFDGGLTMNASPLDFVATLTVFNDGSGAHLYASGRFDRGGGAVCTNLARWDGAHWQPVGDGLPSHARQFYAFDDGAGERLYAVGAFGFTGAPAARGFARWTGSAWEEVGGGVAGPATSMVEYTVDGRPALIVGGNFLSVAIGGAGGGPVGGIAAWLGCDSPCPGDANGDRVVDFVDLNIVLSKFGQSGAALPGDLNGDGTVDFRDLNAVLSFFGGVC